MRELVNRFCEYQHKHDFYCEDRLRKRMERLEQEVAKCAEQRLERDTSVTSPL